MGVGVGSVGSVGMGALIDDRLDALVSATRTLLTAAEVAFSWIGTAGTACKEDEDEEGEDVEGDEEGARGARSIVFLAQR